MKLLVYEFARSFAVNDLYCIMGQVVVGAPLTSTEDRSGTRHDAGPLSRRIGSYGIRGVDITMCPKRNPTATSLWTPSHNGHAPCAVEMLKAA
jgi:hypothetical protein